jgi:hypothetical protein
VDDCKNLSDHEALIRLISATAQNLFVEFTENKLLYQHDVGVNTSTSLDLLQSVWSFNFDPRKIFDLTNQTGKNEIGAPGNISTCAETFTQKLGHAPNQLWAKISLLISALF